MRTACSDLGVPVEQRILMRACVAAFHVGLMDDDLGSAVLASVLHDLAYVGALVVEDLGMDTHGPEPTERGSVGGDDQAVLTSLLSASGRDLAIQACRLSLARVVVSAAERLLERTSAAYHEQGPRPSSSDMELLAAALDAFTEADERLPRVAP
jgi:hypothetical protein